MKYEVLVDGTSRTIEIERDSGGRLHVHMDAKAFDLDAVEISVGVFSMLIAGRVFEARMLPGNGGLSVRVAGRDFAIELRDPRAWRGAQGAVLQAEGRQQIAAPMPGKIVRVLVAAGDMVETGQGLVVVEAMKMQNEIRSPKAGKIERVLVREGQTVSAGERLLIVA